MISQYESIQEGSTLELELDGFEIYRYGAKNKEDAEKCQNITIVLKLLFITFLKKSNFNLKIIGNL